MALIVNTRRPTAGCNERQEDGLAVRGRRLGDDRPHHDIELMDQAGRMLARARLLDGGAGIAPLYAMICEQLGEDADRAEVLVETETKLRPMGGRPARLRLGREPAAGDSIPRDAEITTKLHCASSPTGSSTSCTGI
jgi:hypothetical protein